MKPHFALKLLGCCLLLSAPGLPVWAQSSAFTYQGRLDLNGAPANGSYDLTFALFTVPSGSVPVPQPFTNSATAITNGLFTVTINSLPDGVFNGTPFWLEISARTNGAGSFTTLAPRQPVTPTPYAIFAQGVDALGISGTLPPSSLSGTYFGAVVMNNPANRFGGDGSDLTALNASQLTSGTVPDARLSPNVALRGGGNGFTGNQTIAGNVGIGTTTPATALEIRGVTPDGPSLRLTGIGGFGSKVGIDLATYDPVLAGNTNVAARIEANDWNWSAGIDFQTKVPGEQYSALVSRLFIQNDGKVGIGKTDPATALDVSGTITATGFSGPVAASQITGTLAGANLGEGTITGSKLAPGAAAANLGAAGQSGVASGGLVLSATENAALVNAGYVRVGGAMSTADTWQQHVNGTPPSARHLHTAVWTGSEMIVWGGEQDATPGVLIALNDGGRYNPVTGTWTPMSTTGAPSGRKSHTAVWTGTAMIVWGGRGQGGVVNTGGSYNPATDSWMQMTTEGAPTARRSHTAVWTGNEVIVWGGLAAGLSDDGGRYNPVANTWTLIPSTLANTPGARSGHTAVWTGSEMMVWGGFDGANYFADGRRYNPAGNSWTVASTTGAPVERIGHTAVWTGSEMIVWGGWSVSASHIFKTGGRYNPASDNWTPTSSGGAPGARSDHTAVWTGSEMIVWGGWDASGVGWDDGGRFSPVSNSWTPVGTIGEPAERSGYTAVWASTLMIIWGGRGPGGNSSGYLNDTFSYAPGHPLYLYQRP